MTGLTTIHIPGYSYRLKGKRRAGPIQKVEPVGG
jgi:hypothetical protein